MNLKHLRSQQYRDELKRLLCLKNNVLLLEIPHDVDPNDFPRWIYERVMQSSQGPLLESKMKDWWTIKVKEWIESENYSIDDLRKHAKNKGGTCLSESYKGALVKHEWQCKHGHAWSAKWDSVNRGTWCLQCSGNIVDPIERLEAAISIAKSRGGECLTIAYERANAKMRWRCANPSSAV